MKRIDLPPTKSSLRKVKADLVFAYEGFDLLNQKREILVIEIVKNVKRIREIEKDFKESLDEYYAVYKLCASLYGSENLSLKSLSEKKNYSLHLDSVRLMGLQLPLIEIEQGELQTPENLTGTGAAYDRLRSMGVRLQRLLVYYAALTKTIFLLSGELKKVQRRVNALEKIFIPANEETKKYISERLEEMEREEIFIKKMIGERAGK